ncbi:MAG: class I SAM-dependent methyltransferase [Betaproteobacteria bacterium]|nr:MAG: class I SAM-dependent methyltransferase [Betaproteobacteria bacterium]
MARERQAVSAHGTLGTLFHDAEEPRASDREVAWYAARLPRTAGPVLDVMAGSGRLLIPLLQAGFRVHGIDISEAMLASCRARLEASGAATELFRQNVTALNLPFRYSAAFVARGAFQLLADPTAALDALLRIRAHLIDPGVLLLDLFVPDGAEHPPGAPVVEVRTVAAGADCRIGLRSETFIDVTLRRIDVRSRYERRDRHTITAREDEALALTWYSEDEVLTLLKDAGYCDLGIEPAAYERNDGRHFAVSARARSEGPPPRPRE